MRPQRRICYQGQLFTFEELHALHVRLMEDMGVEPCGLGALQDRIYAVDNQLSASFTSLDDVVSKPRRLSLRKRASDKTRRYKPAPKLPIDHFLRRPLP